MVTMKKIIILCLILLSRQVYSQVLLNLQLPVAGVSLKSQLWNFSIINTGSQTTSIKIEMTFSDVSNHQRVFTGSSRVIQLSQQVTQLQAMDLTPIVYNVLNNNYNVDVNPNGFLPIGQFEVCFAVMKVNQETPERIAEACESIEIEPVSPPILIAPVNEDNLQVSRPFFTWVPPSPVSGFNALSYHWLLVEVQGSQLPSDAVQQNLPVHSQQSLLTNSFLYPSSLPELDTSKVYAWQVAAQSSNNAISKSEIWTFRISRTPGDLNQAISKGYYVPLKTENNTAYTTSTGLLRFEYLNESNDESAVLSFYDISKAGRNALIPDSPYVRLRFGQNFIVTDLGTVPGIIDKHIYLLELKNSKGERWYLKFEYRKPTDN